MTTEQLIDRFRELAAYDLDVSPDVLPDSTVVDYLNQASMELALASKFSNSQISFVPVANQAVYPFGGSAFGRPLISPWKVSIAGLILEAIPLDALDQEFPDWRTATGRPIAWAPLNGGELAIVPAPDPATLASDISWVSGESLPDPLSATALSNRSELPGELHPHIAALAVVIASEPRATETQQWNRIDRMRGLALRAAAVVRERNEMATHDFDWTRRGISSWTYA